MKAVGTALSFPTGSVGEGDFTVTDDRQKLAPVLRKIVAQKLNHSLRVGDLPGFRRHFNLQTVHLRGLEIPPLAGMLSSCEGDGGVVAEFSAPERLEEHLRGRQRRVAAAALCSVGWEHRGVKRPAGAACRCELPDFEGRANAGLSCVDAGTESVDFFQAPRGHAVPSGGEGPA